MGFFITDEVLSAPAASTLETPYPLSAKAVSGHRYYHPGIGRWVSKDPVGQLGGQNENAFVENLPTLYVDIIGLKPTKDADGIHCTDDANRTCCCSAMKVVALVHVLPFSKGHLVGHTIIELPDPIPLPGSTNVTRYVGHYPAKGGWGHVHGPGEWRDNTDVANDPRTRTTVEHFDVCPETVAKITDAINKTECEGYDLFGIGSPNCRLGADKAFKDAGLSPAEGGYEPGATGPRDPGVVVKVAF